MGETTLGMMEKPDAQKRVLEVKELNKILKKAIPFVMKEWKELHSDVPFPTRSISFYRFKILTNISDNKKAEEYLKKMQEKFENQEEIKLEREEKRAKTLTEEQKKKLAQLHELKIEAYSLIKTKCAEVKKTMEEGAKKKAIMAKGKKSGGLGLKCK